VYLRVRTRQFLIAAHVMGLVEIISDEGRLQDYGEVHGDLFYKYANENIQIKLPDSTKKNCSILCVRINPGYVCTVSQPLFVTPVRFVTSTPPIAKTHAIHLTLEYHSKHAQLSKLSGSFPNMTHQVLMEKNSIAGFHMFSKGIELTHARW